MQCYTATIKSGTIATSHNLCILKNKQIFITAYDRGRTLQLQKDIMRLILKTSLCFSIVHIMANPYCE